jgi:hypothetical protein
VVSRAGVAPVSGFEQADIAVTSRAIVQREARMASAW